MKRKKLLSVRASTTISPPLLRIEEGEFISNFAPLFDHRITKYGLNWTFLNNFGSGHCFENGTCTNSLGEFRSNMTDMYFIPAMLSAVIKYVPSIVTIGPIVESSVYQIGSKPNNTQFEVRNLLRAVDISWVVILVFAAFTGLFFLIGRTKRLTALEDTMWDLIRIMLVQQRQVPANMRFIDQYIILLFVIMTGFAALYYNSFMSTDQIALNPKGMIDSIEDLVESNLRPVYDTLGGFGSIIDDSEDEKIMQDINLQKIRTRKWEFGANKYPTVLQEVEEQKAAFITPSGMFRAMCDIIRCNLAGGMKKELHWSKKSFFPSQTAYIYSSHISTELKERLDMMLQAEFEYGLVGYTVESMAKLFLGIDQFQVYISCIEKRKPLMLADVVESPTPLKVQTTKYLFAILAAVDFGAIVLSLIELVVFRRKNRRRLGAWGQGGLFSSSRIAGNKPSHKWTSFNVTQRRIANLRRKSRLQFI